MPKKQQSKEPTKASRKAPKAESPNTATPATVRQVNRAILLNLIRIHQPLSRVKLSDLTGIYRSNVSFIVEELVEEGLVREERSTPSGRGRVPMLLSLNPDGFRVLGVSIRAAATVLSLADLTGKVIESATFATPKSPATWVEHFRRSLESLRPRGESHGAEIRHICISAPGMVSQAKGEVLWMNALPNYSGFKLREKVEGATGIATTVANDCHLAATCERWLGDSSADLRNFVFLEVGDVGVGAGMVVNGELCTGYNSTFAGEFGHMVIDPSGPVCNCGRRGCWELFICDRATWQRYDPSREFTSTRFDELIQLAQSGDKKALNAVRATAKHLSVGISNIIMALNPEVVILAGRLTEVWETIYAPVEEAVAILPGKPVIRPARMKAEALFLHGAISHALSGLFAKPQLG